jgi:hypothetical protein
MREALSSNPSPTKVKMHEADETTLEYHLIFLDKYTEILTIEGCFNFTASN